MNRLFTFMALAFFSLNLALPAQAGLHVEPFAGYLMGKDDGDPKADYTGLDLGARVGYSTLGFSVGGEASRSDLTGKVSSTKFDFKPTNLGAFAAYEFPILIRAYATYIFSSKGEQSSITGLEIEGSGLRLGVGYTGLPFVAINFEYVDMKYDKCTLPGGLGCSIDTKVKLYGVYVSLPLDLL